MEIKRKKITNEKIYETEQKLATQIMDFCQSKKAQFEALGYDLELVFVNDDEFHTKSPYKTQKIPVRHPA